MKSVFPLQRLSGRRAVHGAGGFVVVTLSSVVVANAADTREGVKFFENRIRPVLADKCYECHSADAKKIKGGLLLDTREGLREQIAGTCCPRQTTTSASPPAS